MNSNLPSLTRRLSLKSLLVFTMYFLVSCGGGGNGGSDGPSDLSNSQLRGNWISICNASSGALSMTDTIEFFADGTFSRTASGFFDLACSVPGFDARTTGIVRESNAFNLPDRGVVRNLDLVTNAYIIIPRSEQAVMFFNTEETCGISNWEMGVEHDISSCSNRPGDTASRRPTPFTDYSIYLVERGQLFYGNELSFTADNRPAMLASRPAYISALGVIGDEFPQNFKGFWYSPEFNEYIELGDQGLIRFYGQTTQGCFVFNFLNLFSTGGDRYEDPFRAFAYSINFVDGNLQISFGTDPSVFIYQPADIAVDQLDICM